MERNTPLKAKTAEVNAVSGRMAGSTAAAKSLAFAGANKVSADAAAVDAASLKTNAVHFSTDDKKSARTSSSSADHLLRTQLFVCLFLAAILYFAWRQGGELWHGLARQLAHFLQDGISFSGQDDIMRFTDEVRDFFGRAVESFGRLT